MEHTEAALEAQRPLESGQKPLMHLGYMNINNTIVNGHLLRLRMKDAGIKEFEDTYSMEHELNTRSRYKMTKRFMIMLAILIIVFLLSLRIEMPPGIPGILAGLIVLFVFSTLVGLGSEMKRAERFDALVADIKADENAVKAVFPGYDGVTEWTKFVHDSDAFHYVVDWVRAEILKTVIMIENGDESMRGELRIKFRIALKLFGDYVGRGFNDYFSRQILERMTNHKEGFNLPPVIQTRSAR